MAPSFVQSFTHLKDRPNADRALSMLQRIASLVKPIMRKHDWVLPVLSEFFPDSSTLLGLNVNGGEKILLRLRPAHSPSSFLHEEEVLSTMLHELTHNVHGPHDEKFYKFLSELEDEFEALKRSGYDGEGFHSKGHRVGQHVSHNLPPHLARARALEAAEKRRKVAGMLGGARKLGGVVRRDLTPRELAVQAAQRRVRDDKACGSGEAAKREVEKAARESIQDEIIDLTGDSDDEVIILDEALPSGGSSKVVRTAPELKRPLSKGGRTSSPHTHNHTHTGKRSASASKGATPTVRSPTPPPTPLVRTGSDRHALPRHDVWSCPRCTLVNEPISLQCAACMLIRPTKPISKDGWTCATCGEQDISHQFWSCGMCGSVKLDSSLG